MSSIWQRTALSIIILAHGRLVGPHSAALRPEKRGYLIDSIQALDGAEDAVRADRFADDRTPAQESLLP